MSTLPGIDALPIVDPRGLAIPFWDSWSLDAWIVTDQGETLYPSRLKTVNQYLTMTGPSLAVVTVANDNSRQLMSRVAVSNIGTNTGLWGSELGWKTWISKFDSTSL